MATSLTCRHMHWLLPSRLGGVGGLPTTSHAKTGINALSGW
ncbi:hypothetical protein BJ970_006020 [Saccharopolyspora phatthalungensis]|uniref:Uncharacterized protein n=1 Tax=Saccharopolyspora phatthalungensis TaxID=664693 RepID=A0A840QEJ9_9PSEU|nr:hypothetical protein [Saccharopolyspora phatthalungensis]